MLFWSEYLRENRMLQALASVIFFFACTMVACSATAEAPLALVYDDVGVCAEECALHAANAAKLAGFQVVTVSAATLDQHLSDKASVWIQPGGNAIEVSDHLGVEKLSLIRNFVSRGGGYIGFCAGGFLADVTVDDAGLKPGLGIIPVSAYEYLENDTQAQVLPILWEGFPKHLFFQEGAAFASGLKDRVQVIATYSEGAAAVIQAVFGKGIVIASGVHPEAPEQWLEHEGLSSPDGTHEDLAAELVMRASRK